MLRAMSDPEEDKPIPTKRRTCTLTLRTIRRLDRLKRHGTHGPTIAAVMTAFIEAGVREAIDRGYIRIEDDNE
jgi:hypothetical protein